MVLLLCMIATVSFCSLHFDNSTSPVPNTRAVSSHQPSCPRCNPISFEAYVLLRLPFCAVDAQPVYFAIAPRMFAGSMDDNTKVRRDQLSPQALNLLHLDSSGYGDRSNTVSQQITPSHDGVAPQQCTSLAHRGGSNLFFLDLPPEIRNMIYCCVFPRGQAVVQLLARHSGKGYIAMSDRLELLYTCRQIYKEAASLLQTSRTFKVVQPRSLRHLIDECWYVDDDDDCYCSYCGGFDSNTDKKNRILQRILPQDGLFYEYDIDCGTVKKISRLFSTLTIRSNICVRGVHRRLDISLRQTHRLEGQFPTASVHCSTG